MTDLLLINPSARTQMYGQLGNTLAGIEPPLWCALIASYVREHGYSVKILDADAENLGIEQVVFKVRQYQPLLTVIIVLGQNPSASSTPKMTAVNLLANEIKQRMPDAKLAIGGLHPSALPERSLRESGADYVIQGEGFKTILQLLNTLKVGREPIGTIIEGLYHLEGSDIIVSPRASLVNLNDLPMAAWDLLDMKLYRSHNWHSFEHINQRKPYAMIFTSLGCPYGCLYCNVKALYNGIPSLRFRSPEKVVDEIGYLVNNYHIKNLKFIDELFTLSESHVTEICDLIIERGYDLNIWAYARVGTVKADMLKLMKRAGFNWLGIGFESAKQDVRKGVSKNTGDEETQKTIEMVKSAGIYINANFVFGLTDDDMESMRANLDMAKHYLFEYINFYANSAYPGSALYDEAVKGGVRLPETWDGYAQYSESFVPLPTKYLSAKEVLAFKDWAFRDYMSNSAYQAMVEKKFGVEVVEHIKEMLKIKLKRILLDED